jgi:hypothetical protein
LAKGVQSRHGAIIVYRRRSRYPCAPAN